MDDDAQHDGRYREMGDQRGVIAIEPAGHRESQVIQAADAAHAEPADQQPPSQWYAAADRRQVDRQRTHNHEQHQRQRHARHVPVAGKRGAQQQYQRGGHQPLEGGAERQRVGHHQARRCGRVADVVRAHPIRVHEYLRGWMLMRFASLPQARVWMLRDHAQFGVAQTQARGKGRKKAGCGHRLGSGIGQRHQSQRQEVAGRGVLAGGFQPHAQQPCRPAQGKPDAQAAQQRPGEIAPRPRSDIRARDRAVHHQQRKHQKRQRRAVVQPGLPRKREPQGILVARIVDGHHAGKHGVGRRRDGAQQQRQRPWEAEHSMRHRAQAQHRQHHRGQCQPRRRAPHRSMKTHPQFQAGQKQRDDQRHFGQSRRAHGVLGKIHIHQVQHPRAGDDAGQQIEAERGHRQPVNPPGGQRHQQQQAADQRRPCGKAHGRDPGEVGGWLITQGREWHPGGYGRIKPSTRRHAAKARARPEWQARACCAVRHRSRRAGLQSIGFALNAAWKRVRPPAA